MVAWRYLAQRVLTGEWLDPDLPVTRVSGPSWELSGVGSLRLRLNVEAPASVSGRRVLARDGRELFEEWGTLIYPEADGVIRGGYIVVSSSFVEQAWEIECASFATYPFGIPYDGAEYLREQTDPAVIVRDIWGHVQGHADADLGVSVSGSTAVRVGTTTTRKRRTAETVVKAREADVKAQQKIVDARRKDKAAALKVKQAELKKKQGVYKNVKQSALKVKQAAYKDQQAAYKVLQDKKKLLTKAKKAKKGVAAAEAAVNAAENVLDSKKAVYKNKTDDYKAASNVYKSAQDDYKDVSDWYKGIADRVKAATDVLSDLKDVLSDAKETFSDLKELESEDGGAYLLNWFDSTDCGDEISDLADSVPFDMIESHKWSSSAKTAVTHRVEILYPRAGRKRTDLSFTQGVNVLDHESPNRDGDEYANTVIGLGAGEGAGAVHRSTAVRDGRLRRTRIVEAKHVKTASRMDAVIRGELTRARKLVEVPSITVIDHPNARIGSWQLGDDILIRATFPHLGKIAIWHRITAWELLTDDTAKLTLARSDSFVYGG